MVDTWEPDSRVHPSPGEGKPETFDIQGLELGRTRVKILVRCAAPSSSQNLGAVRLSCHSPCLSVGRCTTPSKGIKNLPRSPAAIPSLPCCQSVSVNLASEGQFNLRSRKKRKLPRNNICSCSKACWL
ncbi:unnamed protein product [Rangifer tarandus platyrhynchus]|uniref:Uncharacterized protein n=1 Tax=Rangifer tarandus platyrhynchus TaxID=3082113 RepID=A0ABN9A3J8_RANTA|nr:unnamed protein product [Rangifer tarandus platyrhynchus]